MPARRGPRASERVGVELTAHWFEMESSGNMAKFCQGQGPQPRVILDHAR